MKDVTPKSNSELFLKSIGIAVIIIIAIALIKSAFEFLMSIIGWVIPIALICFLYMKFNNKE